VSVVFAAAAAIAFGHRIWPAFIDTLTDPKPNLDDLATHPEWVVSIFGLLASAGVSKGISWTAHLAIAALAAAAIGILWAKPIPHSLKAAILCIGSVAVTPYVHVYDLSILSIAVAFLVKDGLARGFLPGERVTMLTCWLCLFQGMAPIQTIICDILLGTLIVRRVVLRRREPLAASRPLLQAQGPQ
jgi:hypothetical protein